MNLDDLRHEIDAIDEELVELFIKRMGLSLKVAEYKKENHLPVLNPEREREILNKVSDKVSAKAGAELDAYAKTFFNTLFDVSRSYQKLFLENARNRSGSK